MWVETWPIWSPSLGNGLCLKCVPVHFQWGSHGPAILPEVLRIMIFWVIVGSNCGWWSFHQMYFYWMNENKYLIENILWMATCVGSVAVGTRPQSLNTPCALPVLLPRSRCCSSAPHQGGLGAPHLGCNTLLSLSVLGLPCHFSTSWNKSAGVYDPRGNRPPQRAPRRMSPSCAPCWPAPYDTFELAFPLSQLYSSSPSVLDPQNKWLAHKTLS